MPFADEALLQRLRLALANGPPLELAVLFGSRVSGRPRSDSDFDIGIALREPSLPLGEELELAATLSRALGAEVDLVRLDRDDPLLGREIARHAVCVFEARPGAFAAYRASAMSRWVDFDETTRPHRERFLRRLAEAAR